VNGPQKVIGNHTFVNVNVSRDGGYNHTCAITARGKAYCWGANGSGQLGDGTTNQSRANGPQAVIGGLRFTSINPGQDHTCALTSKGRAYCWGANNYGQLADGTVSSSNANGPQPVIGGLKFASINGGAAHTCALTSRGKAYCWGANYDGQLGDGTTRHSNENGPQAVQ
jgi:alpha-tubulin suppressor-like RCC1 family protein